MSPGAAGLCITYLLTLSDAAIFVSNRISELETHMIAVERCYQLT